MFLFVARNVLAYILRGMLSEPGHFSVHLVCCLNSPFIRRREKDRGNKIELSILEITLKNVFLRLTLLYSHLHIPLVSVEAGGQLKRFFPSAM